jgi:hypothetical protein
METIKNFFKGVAKFAYDFFIGPIVELRNFFTMSNTVKALSIINAASRVIVIASWFFAVPAVLVTLAWVWIWTTVAVAVLYIVFSMGSLAAAGAFGADLAAKLHAANDGAAEQAAATEPAAA